MHTTLPHFVRRPLLVMAAFGIASGAWSQDKKVTYATLGGSAKAVLADLSSKTGLTLTTNVQTEGDYLFVNVKDVPVTKLMEKIAWSLAGSWKKDGESYMLVRTDSDRVAAERAANAREVVAFAAGIKKRSAKLAKEGVFDEAKATQLARSFNAAIKNGNPRAADGSFYQSLAKLGRQAPISRALGRLISQFSAQELASLPGEYMSVFSTRPTNMQRPFSSQSNPIFAAYFRESTIWREAARRENVQPKRDGEMVYSNSFIPDLEQDSTPNRLVLVATKMKGMRGIIQFQLLATDDKGIVLDRADDLLAAEEVEAFSEEVKPQKGEALIELSEEEKKVAKAVGDIRADSEALQKLLDPVKTDPLTLLAAPIFREFAKASKVNLVANIADLEFMLGSMAAQEKLPARMVEKIQRLFCEEQNEDGWVCWRPGDFMESKSNTANRRFLGEYLRRCAQPNSMTFEEKAYWAFRLPMDEQFSSMAIGLGQRVRSAATGTSESEYYNPKFLKLYGSLTSEQRNALRKGGLPTSALSREQTLVLSELTFGANTRMQLVSQGGPNGAFDFSELNTNPTEALPNGIPNTAMITLDDRSEEVVYAKSTNTESNYSYQQAMSPDMAAWHRFSVTRPDLYPWVTQQDSIDFERVLYGKQTTFTFLIKYSERVQQSFQVQDRAYASLTPTSFDRLPASFLEKYQAAYKRQEEMAKHQQPGNFSGGNNNPPPPGR